MSKALLKDININKGIGREEIKMLQGIRPDLDVWGFSIILKVLFGDERWFLNTWVNTALRVLSVKIQAHNWTSWESLMIFISMNIRLFSKKSEPHLNWKFSIHKTTRVFSLFFFLEGLFGLLELYSGYFTTSRGNLCEEKSGARGRWRNHSGAGVSRGTS